MTALVREVEVYASDRDRGSEGRSTHNALSDCLWGRKVPRNRRTRASVVVFGMLLGSEGPRDASHASIGRILGTDWLALT